MLLKSREAREGGQEVEEESRSAQANKTSRLKLTTCSFCPELPSGLVKRQTEGKRRNTYCREFSGEVGRDILGENTRRYRAPAEGESLDKRRIGTRLEAYLKFNPDPEQSEAMLPSMGWRRPRMMRPNSHFTQPFLIGSSENIRLNDW